MSTPSAPWTLEDVRALCRGLGWEHCHTYDPCRGYAELELFLWHGSTEKNPAIRDLVLGIRQDETIVRGGHTPRGFAMTISYCPESAIAWLLRWSLPDFNAFPASDAEGDVQ